MKNIFSLPLAIALLILVCTGSCKQDDDGMSIDNRERFLGAYSVVDNCSISGMDQYTATIRVATTGDNDVLIDNFWNVTINPTMATVSGNTITIPRQDPDSDNVFAAGSGTLSGNVITWNYTIESVAGTDVCSNTTYTK